MKPEELSCKDLMVGDWVDVRNDAAPNTPHLERITPSHFLRDEHWYGVELVPEILEKNGWEKRPTGYVFYTDGKRYDNSLWYIFGSNTFVVNTAEFQIEYVHELQHALKLCGIEKTFEL